MTGGNGEGKTFEGKELLLPGSQSSTMSWYMLFSNSVPMSSIPLPDATFRWNSHES